MGHDIFVVGIIIVFCAMVAASAYAIYKDWE